jgi:hypothetical protein
MWAWGPEQTEVAMIREADAADAMAVALVTAMIDRFDSDDEPSDGHRHAARIAAMITDARFSGVDLDEYIGALGVLGARAVQDLASATGEPIALWLERWLSEPYGTPSDI